MAEPTGDLRDLRERLAEAMRAHYIGDQTTAMGEHLCVCGEWADGTDTDDWDVHLADAVLPVFEAETGTLTFLLRKTEDELHEQRKRAEEAERLRDAALAALPDLIRVAAHVSRGRSAVDVGPYPDALARRALGALDDATIRAALDQPEETPDA